MLTIRAMAEMGPWILTLIEVLDGRHEQCQRCDTWIKWVWIMEKQTEPKETRRIGSECGPNLEDMSEELWQRTARPFKTCVRHVSTLEKLARWERELPMCCPAGYQLGWARQQQRVLAAGGLDDRQRRVIGRNVSQADQAWRAAINKYRALWEVAKRANSLPTRTSTDVLRAAPSFAPISTGSAVTM